MAQFVQDKVFAIYDREGCKRLLATFLPMLILLVITVTYNVIATGALREVRPSLFYLSYAVMPFMLVGAYLLCVRVVTFALGALNPNKPAVYLRENTLVFYNKLYFSVKLDKIEGMHIMPYKYKDSHMALYIQFKGGGEKAVLCDAIDTGKIAHFEAKISLALADR